MSVTLEPLRIGMACFSSWGGSGVVASVVGMALGRRGHRVCFFSDQPPPRLDPASPNVSFHLVATPAFPPLSQRSYALALTARMIDVAERENLQIFHAHYAIPHAVSANLARQILQGQQQAAPKVVTTLHGTDVTRVGSDNGFRPITRFAVMASDAVTVPSRWLAETARTSLGLPDDLPIDVIANFVDSAQFSSPVTRDADTLARRNPEPSRAEREGGPRSTADRGPSGELLLRPPRPEEDGRGNPGRPPVLAHVSNFRALKRVDDVVRIFAVVRAHRPARLELVGEGPERPRIEAMVRELGLAGEVDFQSEIPHGDLARFYGGVDVFLLPSEQESFGLAALEAMACGVPVIASCVGGLPDVVAEGETGFLSPVGDVAAMAAHVSRLLAEPALHATMASRARQRAVAVFSPAPAIAAYEEVYRRVLG
ncbi:MAG: glycosyltransferase [Polyangia bacterium]|jgi:glycosyltransferase involved in cell wall biosynthesis